MIKIFADGADIDDILALCQDPRISGFTTNPTLMRKAGVVEYQGFARKVLDHVTDRPCASRSSPTTSMRCAVRRTSSTVGAPTFM